MKVSKEAVDNQDTNKINPYKLNQYKQSEARLKATVFVDRNEELKVVLGDSYLKNYIQTGRLEKSFAILTDRRVYMKGKCYEKKGLFGLRSTNIDKVIDVQDITGTEYRSRRLPLLKPISLVVSIISLYFLFVCTVASISTQWEEMIGNVITALVFVITLICWGVFLFVRNSYEFLDISFAGGQIAYDCSVLCIALGSFHLKLYCRAPKQIFGRLWRFHRLHARYQGSCRISDKWENAAPILYIC